MPSIQTSLASAVPCWLGRMPSCLVMPGVRAYKPSRLAENAVRPTPAAAVGTTGSSRAEPSAISPIESSFAKSLGLILFRNGYVPAAIPCSRVAVSSSADHFPRPALRMNAPVASRPGSRLALAEKPINLPFLFDP